MEQTVDTTIVDSLTKISDSTTAVIDSVKDSIMTAVDTVTKVANTTATASAELTTSGMIFMVGSWVMIIALCAFCFTKVFRNKN